MEGKHIFLQTFTSFYIINSSLTLLKYLSTSYTPLRCLCHTFVNLLMRNVFKNKFSNAHRVHAKGIYSIHNTILLCRMDDQGTTLTSIKRDSGSKEVGSLFTLCVKGTDMKLDSPGRLGHTS